MQDQHVPGAFPEDMENYAPRGSQRRHKMMPRPPRVDSSHVITSGPVHDIKDVYIAVMGVTGSGKSSFIQLCTNQDCGVGDGLKSETREVGAYSFMYKPNVRVHLIDTPGFDDSDRTDTDVLRDIAEFLGTAYELNKRLSGLIYCHRIIDPKMQGSAQRNLHMFRALCGEDCYRQIALITTQWELIPPAIGAAREKELIDTEEFWGCMRKKGSHILRHPSQTDRSSVINILDVLVQEDRRITLDIQREMNEEGLGLEQTSAGKRLNADIIEMRKKHQKDLKALEQDMRRAMAEKDKEQTQLLKTLLSDTEKKIKAGEESQERLKADLQNLQIEREAAMAKLQAELKASQDQYAEEQLKFRLLHDQQRADTQSIVDEHKAKLEQIQRDQENSKEEIRKKAAGSQANWDSFISMGGKVICSIVDATAQVILEAYNAETAQLYNEGVADGFEFAHKY